MLEFKQPHRKQLNRIPSRWLWNSLLIVGAGVSSLLATPGSTHAQPYQSFQQWCLNRASLTAAQKTTINVLLDSANTQDCERAQAHLSQIKSLNLAKKDISDLAPFTSLPQLTSLMLPGNPIRDISPLTKLPNLTFLIVAFTEVEDVSPLSNLNQLTYLVLEGNQIKDLSPLKGLTQLNSLIALNNPLNSKECPLLPVTKCVFSDDGATLVKQAKAHNEKGDFTLARQVFNEARDLYTQQNDPMRLGDVINHLADLDLKIGHYANAIKGYEKAIALRRRLGDIPGIGISLVQQAKAFEKLGLYEKSEESLVQATANSEKQWQLGIPLEGGLYELPKDTGALYQNLAIVRNRLGKPQEALQAAQASLKNYGLLPEGYSGKRVGHQSTLAVMGQSYRQLSLHSRAQATLEEALSMARTHQDAEGTGQILTLLAELSMTTNRNQAAIKFLDEALSLQQSLGNKPALGKTLHLLGTVHLHQGKPKESVQNLLSAIEIWESLRPGLNDDNKVALFETQLATYEQLQLALMAQNKKEKALEISERGRARAFVELIASQIEGDVKDQLSQAKPPSISEIQQIAKTQRATLVEYSIVGEMLVIWVIQPSGEISVRTTDLSQLSQSLDKTAERARLAAKTGSVRGASQVTENQLTEMVRGNRDDLLSDAQDSSSQENRKNTETDTQTSRSKNRRLRSTYKLLIDPIADLLPDNPDARVVIIPQGPLFLVPFATLQDEQGQYLIEKHTLMMSPAISVLALTHQIKTARQPSASQNAQPNDVLIVGNPTMPSIPLSYGATPKALSPLPGAESEAIAIASLLDTNALIGNEAKERQVVEKMQSAPVVHLATHGLLDELKYMGIQVPGAIALTPNGDTSEQDGLLTSEEILAMDLKADLVVLSACNTGRGKITGDGVVGLSRSFISAGVPSVVVSLWAVPDAPTSALMKAFYQQLQTEPDKAKALRLAMMETMKDYPQPQDWGAFILIGEAE